MPTRPTTRSTILGIAPAALVTSCAADDPIVLPTPTTTEAPTTTTTTTTTTSTTTTTTAPPATTTTIAPALTDVFEWGERSDNVRTLQVLLDVEADGVYGPVTRTAHETALDDLGLPTDDLPERPVTRSVARSLDDVPAPILESVQNLWPEAEWNRALTVAFCESGFRVDAANPTSSARTVPAPRPLATRPRHRPDRVGLALHRRRREALRRCRSRDL